uniref:Major facilitator superfamily (MFS) profile domain-containing protein n=1 Tax=Ciona savignyi TaxID=51511 RepID=H2ZBB1_CIOSA
KMGYDSIIDRLGSFGLFQKRLFVLFFLNGIPNGLLITAIVFLHFVPTHRCKLPFYERQYNQTQMDRVRQFVSVTTQMNGCGFRNLSTMQINQLLEKPSFNYSEDIIPAVDDVACYEGYDYVSDTGIESAMMEFDVVCGDAWKKPMISSLYLVGMTVGTLSGIISDKLGRRPVFLASTLLQFLTVFCTSFAPTLTTYCILLAICGLSHLINYLSAFVIGAEFTTPNRRNLISISSFISFSVGYMIGPLAAYFVPNWRWLMRLHGLIGILYIPMYWLIPESPRWLLSHGKREEAMTILGEVARINGCNVNKEEIEMILGEELDVTKDEVTEKGLLFHVLTVIRNSRTLIMVLIISVAIVIVYFGISLSVDTLSGNIFINCFLMGLIEIPGLIAAFMGVKYCSRSYAHSGFMFLSGFACLLAALLKNVHPIATLMFALIGKTANAGVFYIVYVHTAEIVPTNVRNVYMCAGSFAGRVGSILAPYFGYAGKFEIFGFFAPYLTLSVVVMTSALMTLLFLPDTHLKRLPESVEEVLKMK